MKCQYRIVIIKSVLNLFTFIFNLQPDEDLEDPDERHDPDSDMEVDDRKLPDETPRYLIFTDLFLFTHLYACCL